MIKYIGRRTKIVNKYYGAYPAFYFYWDYLLIDIFHI